MADKNNFLLVLAVIILLMVVAFVLRNISGLVTSNVDAKVDINRETIVCDPYDESHVIAVTIDPGSDEVSKELVLRSLRKNGEIMFRETLCQDVSCKERISKNIIIPCSLETGEYYFEISRICASQECEQLGASISSSIIEITHI